MFVDPLFCFMFLDPYKRKDVLWSGLPTYGASIFILIFITLSTIILERDSVAFSNLILEVWLLCHRSIISMRNQNWLSLAVLCGGGEGSQTCHLLITRKNRYVMSNMTQIVLFLSIFNKCYPWIILNHSSFETLPQHFQQPNLYLICVCLYPWVQYRWRKFATIALLIPQAVHV